MQGRESLHFLDKTPNIFSMISVLFKKSLL